MRNKCLLGLGLVFVISLTSMVAFAFSFEAKCRAYLYDNENIYLETPIDNVKYHLKLHFEDRELFKRMKRLLFNNQNHVIIIAGKWESSGGCNCFVTEVVSDRQIKVLKRELK